MSKERHENNPAPPTGSAPVKSPVSILEWILGSLFTGVLLVLGFRIWVHPEFIRFSQQPVFFWEKHFFRSRLSIPGGILDIAGAYLTDLLESPWPGALVLAVLVLLSVLLIHRVIRPGKWALAAWIPGLCLLVMHLRYSYHLSSTLSLLAALAGFLIFRRVRIRNAILKLIFTLIWTALIYLISPGALFLFIPLAVLSELIGQKTSLTNSLSIAGLILTFILLPVILSSSLFLVPLKKAFLHQAFFLEGNKILIPGILLPLCIIALFIVFSRVPERPRSGFLLRLAQWAVIAALVVLCMKTGIPDQQRRILAIRYAAHTGKWKEVNDQIHNLTVRHPVCMFHINRSLAHQGSLGAMYFSLPQLFGKEGLFLDPETALEFPLDRSDFYFDIGHINESKRWAYEALTLFGESKDILKRLALISIIQDEPAAASKFLKRLSRNPNAKKWTDHYLGLLRDPSLIRNESLLQNLHAMMPKEDFIVMTRYPELDLELMVDAFPKNRLALEYVMMNDLIDKNLESFLKHLHYYRAFSTGSLPVHYEEALIACTALKKIPENLSKQFQISRKSLDDFRDFQNRFLKYKGDQDAARPELSQMYGKTYWFYMIYGNKKS